MTALKSIDISEVRPEIDSGFAEVVLPVEQIGEEVRELKPDVNAINAPTGNQFEWQDGQLLSNQEILDRILLLDIPDDAAEYLVIVAKRYQQTGEYIDTRNKFSTWRANLGTEGESIFGESRKDLSVLQLYFNTNESSAHEREKEYKALAASVNLVRLVELGLFQEPDILVVPQYNAHPALAKKLGLSTPSEWAQKLGEYLEMSPEESAEVHKRVFDTIGVDEDMAKHLRRLLVIRLDNLDDEVTEDEGESRRQAVLFGVGAEAASISKIHHVNGDMALGLIRDLCSLANQKDLGEEDKNLYLSLVQGLLRRVESQGATSYLYGSYQDFATRVRSFTPRELEQAKTEADREVRERLGELQAYKNEVLDKLASQNISQERKEELAEIAMSTFLSNHGRFESKGVKISSSAAYNITVLPPGVELGEGEELKETDIRSMDFTPHGSSYVKALQNSVILSGIKGMQDYVALVDAGVIDKPKILIGNTNPRLMHFVARVLGMNDMAYWSALLEGQHPSYKERKVYDEGGPVYASYDSVAKRVKSLDPKLIARIERLAKIEMSKATTHDDPDIL